MSYHSGHLSLIQMPRCVVLMRTAAETASSIRHVSITCCPLHFHYDKVRPSLSISGQAHSVRVPRGWPRIRWGDWGWSNFSIYLESQTTARRRWKGDGGKITWPLPMRVIRFACRRVTQQRRWRMRALRLPVGPGGMCRQVGWGWLGWPTCTTQQRSVPSVRMRRTRRQLQSFKSPTMTTIHSFVYLYVELNVIDFLMDITSDLPLAVYYPWLVLDRATVSQRRKEKNNHVCR